MRTVTPAQKLGLPEWLPPFCWSSPIIWALWIFAVNGLILIVAWKLFERLPWRQYHPSNLWGDTIGLPLVAFGLCGMVNRLPDHHITAWYTSSGFYLTLLAVLMVGWYGFTYFVEYGRGHGDVNLKQYLAPSKGPHTLLWPYYAFALIAVTPAALTSIDPFPGMFVIALAGFMLWGYTCIQDFSTQPPPLGGIPEFSWSQWYVNACQGRLFSGPSPARVRVDLWKRANKRLPNVFHAYYEPTGWPRP